jgi:hypothetical protein
MSPAPPAALVPVQALRRLRGAGAGSCPDWTTTQNVALSPAFIVQLARESQR